MVRVYSDIIQLPSGGRDRRAMYEMYLKQTAARKGKLPPSDLYIIKSVSNALQAINKWAAETKDVQLQVKAISVTLSLLYGDLQFSSVYRPSKETLKQFKMR